jgi:hypothetical protein
MMMKHFPINQFLMLFSLLFVMQACKDAPNEGIPAYVQIEDVTLSTQATQGSNLHFINSLWLETEGENLGVYEFPNVVPALVSGNREIIVNAGVYVRGDYFNREIYPAFQPYKVDIDFVPGDTVKITPVFEYYDEVLFALIEDFESGNIFGGLPRTDVSDTNNIEGKALVITVNAADDLVKGTTSSSVNIPFGKKVYIEMHFKANIDFAIGIQSVVNGSVSQTGYIDRFLPSDNWYKVYYDISNIVNSLDSDNYNFFIEVEKLRMLMSRRFISTILKWW